MSLYDQGRIISKITSDIILISSIRLTCDSSRKVGLITRSANRVELARNRIYSRGPVRTCDMQGVSTTWRLSVRQFRLSPMPRAGREKGFVQRNVKRTCHVAFWGVRMRKTRIMGAFGARSAPHAARGNTLTYNPRSMAANEGARARAPVSAIAEAPVEMFMTLT